jgi:type II secretory pathway component PulK
MRKSRRHWKRCHGRGRHGIAALITVVCLSVVMAIGAVLLKASQAERHFDERLVAQVQADWLAEAGISRAAAQLAASIQYKGETWKIPASHLNRAAGDAVVRIEIKPDSSNAKRRVVHVIAAFSPIGSSPVETSKEARMAVAAL